MEEAEKQNIIFVTNLHLWSLEKNKGGKAFYSTVQGYIKANWNVILISTGGGIPRELYQKAIVFEKRYNCADKFVANKFKVISFLGRLLKFYFNNKFYYKTAKNAIKQAGAKNTIVYAYEVEGVKAAKRIANKFHIPLTIRFQGTILANIEDTFINRIRRTPHFSALKTTADLVIMTNDGTKGHEVLKRIGNKSYKIVFWRNGVDGIQSIYGQQEYFDKHETDILDDAKFYFLTVSRLVDWKRVNLAIQGLSKIIKKYPQAHLIVVGDGPEMESLVNLTKTLSIDSHVTFKGAVQQDEIKEIMAESNAFLSFYDLSNLGNPIMEAMIAGLPIVTIDVGDTKELIKNNENGFLIPADKLEFIPIFMEKVLVDSKLRHKFSKAAQLTAKNEFISWDERIENEIRLVGNLISSNKS
jgi:glycosyltransferase involved in cell wall biosynthesis